jgi:hypothetical protein
MNKYINARSTSSAILSTMRRNKVKLSLYHALYHEENDEVEE